MLDDLLIPDLDVVFCGTAVGHRSAAERAYYARPGNRFWQTLAEIGLTPGALAPTDYRRRLEYGIGLTDLVKSQSGNDSDLRFSRSDTAVLEQKIAACQPQYLCFNGKRGAEAFLARRRVAFGVQPETIGRTIVYVAPSTSGAARASWDRGVWQQLANLIAARRQA